MLLALILVAREVPALAALALSAMVCAGLIVYEVTFFREDRAEIRASRRVAA